MKKSALLIAIGMIADGLRDGMANAKAAETEYKRGKGFVPLAAHAAKAGILEARCETAEKMLRGLLDEAR
jgi:hypothetical protein